MAEETNFKVGDRVERRIEEEAAEQGDELAALREENENLQAEVNDLRRQVDGDDEMCDDRDWGELNGYGKRRDVHTDIERLFNATSRGTTRAPRLKDIVKIISLGEFGSITEMKNSEHGMLYKVEYSVQHERWAWLPKDKFVMADRGYNA